MNRLRVVIVARRFWPLVGGPERVLANLAVELASRGCEAVVLTARWQPNWPSEIRVHDVPVIRLSQTAERGWGNLRYMRRLAHWLRTNQEHFDLVYVSQLKHEAYAAMRTVGRQMPVVLRAERPGPCGDCQWQREASCGRRIAAECRQSAAVVGANAEIERELLAAGYPRSNVYRVANGVHDAPPRTPARRNAARTVLGEANEQLEMSAASFLAVYAGRLEANCGLERLIDAWEPLARRRPTARLWLVGEGSRRSALQRRIESLNLEGKVVLVGVFDQVDAVLAAADVFVRPTPETGTSLALLEAFAAGLPVVASDTASHRELIADGRDGLLAPAEEAAWSAAIVRLFDEPALAARLGAAAREKAAGHTLAKMADSHLTLF